jgi:hypothetical protein
MPPWTIVYGDGRWISGDTLGAWVAAPSENVQVIIAWVPPAIDERRWTGVADRLLWTGDDTYDPFGTGRPKRGRLLPDAAYHRLWNQAAYGPRRRTPPRRRTA